MRRIAAAFLISPGVVALLLAMADTAIGRDTGSSMVALATLPMTYAVAWVLGIPALWLFRRFKWRSLWQFALAGTLFGLAPLIVWRPGC
ncbi:MAG: hypothetical protein ABJA83_04815 [Burkholderiaceae bacterium]